MSSTWSAISAKSSIFFTSIKDKASYPWVAGFVLFILTWIVFWPSLSNDFTHYDDQIYVLFNPMIRELSWANTWRILTDLDYLFPLTIFSYNLEYYFFGLNPFPYHFNNLLLHALNAVLVYAFVRLLLKRNNIAFWTAILFAVHPMRVESVAWIAERKDVLSGVFYLGALISYVLSIRDGVVKKRWLVGTWGLFILALMAKQQSLTLPAVLVAIDYFYKRVTWKTLCMEKAVFWLTAGAYLLIVYASFKGQAAALPPTMMIVYTPLEKFILAQYAFVMYIVKNFLVLNTSLLYPLPQRVNGHLSWWMFVMPLLTVLFGLLLYRLREHRAVVFGGLMFVLNIGLPILLIWHNSYIICDHYMYLPSIGLFLAALLLIEHWMPLKSVYILLGIYVLVLSVFTFKYCFAWKDDITIWSHVIEQYPQEPIAAIAYNNRGYTYQVITKDYQQALRDLSKAVELCPKYKDALLNRGALYVQFGFWAEGLKDFQAVLALDPADARAADNIRLVQQHLNANKI